MSILNKLFGNTQQPQANPQSQQPQQPEGVTNNTTVPNAENTPHRQEANGQEASSPLDAYKDIWDNMSNGQEDAGNVLTFDRAKLAEVANKMDFTDSITPEQLSAIANGGEAAIKTLANVLNTTSRNAYLNSTETTSHLINNALNRTVENFTSSLPQHIKKANVSQTMQQENPMYNDPAVAPVLQALENQLTAKYPNATAHEITQHAKEYLTKFAGVVAPQPNPQDTNKLPPELDFSSWG